MDERLEAGRHHLQNGIRAMRTGYLDESRSHFEAALLQFRGPELRLGEAHALRGLGEVELHGGNVAAAEVVVRRSIVEYQEVRNQLDRVDPEQVSRELRHDAEEGEGAAHVLLGELLVRAGRAEEARRALAYAREIYAGLGEDTPSAAGVHLTLGRLGLREAAYDDARASLQKAISILERSGDRIGQCGAWLQMAEVERLAGRLEAATTALDHAARIADETRQPAMQGRARSQQASLLAQQQRLPEAAAAYDEALHRIRESGDVEMEAYALLGRGDVRSRMGDPSALFDLVEAARLLGALDHRHGLGAAMLRLSEHALRAGYPVYALAAAESTRQLWQPSDPRRGVGQALRMQVKALAALKKWPAVLMVAHARAALAGDVQPNAIEVREFYRARSPAGLLSEIDLLDDAQIESRAEQMVEGVLEPMLRQLDLDFQSLGLPGGAMTVMQALGRATPAPAPSRATPAPAPTAAPPLEQAPPEEPAAPADRGPYAALYTPPAGAPFAADDAAKEAPAPAEDATTEARSEGDDDDALLARLRAQPAPAGYAALYDAPGRDEE